MRNAYVISLLVLIAAFAYAQAPNFDYPFMMTNSAGYIVDNNVYDIPTFGDWDDDGDMDMMVGVFYNGNIFYYQNISTGVTPEFAAYSMVQADGVNITVTYG